MQDDIFNTLEEQMTALEAEAEAAWKQPESDRRMEFIRTLLLDDRICALDQPVLEINTLLQNGAISGDGRLRWMRLLLRLYGLHRQSRNLLGRVIELYSAV